MENFISATADLFEAFPGATVSITYSNVGKKNTEPKQSAASHIAKFKVFDAHTGKCIRYKTSKSKEVSRILTYLGPRGVSGLKRQHEGEHEENKKQRVGVSSIMANSKFEEPEVTAEPEKVEEETKKPPKKKKKGKKK
ncbi:putative signal recognition particle subunit [Clavispora lusitaniae]|uniref:Signal recognition particle subunit n=1 Tax=Clavispora lusitaniae TaxID=36911 RepID=A0AA91PV76_CLALS|nr:putative signal recognition particle subunit [Clavispora lusitaniae]